MTEITKIWLTWFINRILGFLGPVLMTYGISYSDSTAELLAGTVITGVTVWVSQRTMKKAIDSNPTEPVNDKAGSIPVSLIIVPLLFLPLVGCASFAPNYSALPPDATREQKREAALADTRAALSSKRNQAIAEVVISEAGKYAVSTVKDRVDKEAIKTQLKGCGEAGLALLSSGKQITPDQMRSVFSISSLTSKLDAEKFSKQFSTAFEPIQDYIDEVSQTDDPKLLRDWFEILCRSSIKAGS